MAMSDPTKVLDEFCTICERVWMDHELYISVCETDQRTLDLLRSVAPLYFNDINRILIEHQLLQFSKITDPAKTRDDANLTTNYILEEFDWPTEVREKLRAVNERLMAFRKYIDRARSKRVAHVDLTAQVERPEILGGFPEGADKQFLQDLQLFVDIAYRHLHNGEPCPIDVAMATDTHRLVKALEKSVIYDRCPKCTEYERVKAVLEFRRERASDG
jgi:hypothetical protein